MDGTRLNFLAQDYPDVLPCYQIMVIAKRRVDIGLFDIAIHQGLVCIICFFCSYIDEDALVRR